MSRLYNACLATAAALLSFASCSTLLPSGKTTQSTAEELVDSLAQAQADSMIIAVNQAHNSVNEQLESELIYPDSLDIALGQMPEDHIHEEFEDAREIFHFEGAQTTSTVIDEYRNFVVEDMVVDLSAEDSYYPADGHVTSKYGWRSRRMHAGIDLKAQKGDNLYAAFDGVVRLAKYYSSYGNCVIIRHYNGLETLYAHATKLLVEVNDVVKAGDVIALAGSTGRSTGSHLHFEVRVAGHYFNPDLILDTDNRKIKDANLYITMRNGRLFASNNDSEEEREAYILQQISIRYHTVRSGDTLSGIASKNGTSVATICRLNGISSKSILRIGQRLIVRDGIKPPAATKNSEPAATSTTAQKPAAATTPSSSQNSAIYTVKKGDTLGAIAKRNGTSVSAICALNNISAESTLSIGQKLKLSGSAYSAPAQSSSAAQYHIVKSGDTLGGIAQKYGTTISKLCSLNGISRTSILQLKQKIRVR